MTAFSGDLHPGTKSRPLYPPVAPEPGAHTHLIVSQSAALPPGLVALFGPTPFEIWTDLATLGARLAEATTGLHLHATGDEAFLWDAAGIAQAAGLGADEIHLHPADRTLRRVRCLHCRALADAVTERTLDCPGCGVRLLVRDHFSRRLGAFQGVATQGVTRGETA